MIHEADAFELAKMKQAEDLLQALRKGNSQKLEIGIADCKFPVRLINAKEKALIILQAKQAAGKQNPTGLEQRYFDAIETQKRVLTAATTINGAPALPLGFLDMLTERELEELYDQYETISRMVNPNLQELSAEQILQIVDGIKKKSLNTKGLYTWQLAEVGRYFLDVIIPSLPTDKDSGSV
jgi:hypothetical protein